jgi:hypothetical protein
VTRERTIHENDPRAETVLSVSRDREDASKTRRLAVSPSKIPEKALPKSRLTNLDPEHAGKEKACRPVGAPCRALGRADVGLRE